MENKNIIILVLIIIVIALLVGIFATMPHANKQDTNLTFKSNSTINEDDSIKIQLTDANGTGIANQTVNITITDKDKSSDYHSVETNDKGIGTLNIDKNAGNYTITVNYAGNDKYIGCNATKKITIDKKVVEAESETQQSTQSSSSSNNGGIHYDEEINVYYDDNGVVVDPDGHHPQSVGSNYDDLRDARDRWERGEPVMV